MNMKVRKSVIAFLMATTMVVIIPVVEFCC